jgi:hypothetical protein
VFDYNGQNSAWEEAGFAYDTLARLVHDAKLYSNPKNVADYAMERYQAACNADDSVRPAWDSQIQRLRRQVKEKHGF